MATFGGFDLQCQLEPFDSMGCFHSMVNFGRDIDQWLYMDHHMHGP